MLIKELKGLHNVCLNNMPTSLKENPNIAIWPKRLVPCQLLNNSQYFLFSEGLLQMLKVATWQINIIPI
jgi:hypothetical protein